ncbi:MAG: type II toxin-antitoxin system HicB family antitoxin [Calditrichaeota bacterium]|nr:type II toxin-antitoxin system HicB family antitoxin [Calditrichota bacterium]
MFGRRRKLKLEIPVIIEADGEGYHGYTPALKGVHVYGKTKAEAEALMADALTAYIDSIIKHGESIPIHIVLDEEDVKEFNENEKDIEKMFIYA